LRSPLRLCWQERKRALEKLASKDMVEVEPEVLVMPKLRLNAYADHARGLAAYSRRELLREAVGKEAPLPDYLSPSAQFEEAAHVSSTGVSPRMAEAAARARRSEEALETLHGLTEELMLEAMLKIKWFADLERDELIELSRRGTHKFFPRYSTVFREGSYGDCFYIILQGSVLCSSNSKATSATLPAGCYVGETALIAHVQRELTASALEDSVLLLFQLDDLKVRRAHMRAHIQRQIVRHVISRLLESVPFFKSLSKAAQDGLAEIMEVRFYQSQRLEQDARCTSPRPWLPPRAFCAVLMSHPARLTGRILPAQLADLPRGRPRHRPLPHHRRQGQDDEGHRRGPRRPHHRPRADDRHRHRALRAAVVRRARAVGVEAARRHRHVRGADEAAGRALAQLRQVPRAVPRVP
jgi:CRP-like cAMP-binding protein